MFINAEKIGEAFKENRIRILLYSGNKQDEQKLSNCEVELE